MCTCTEILLELRGSVADLESTRRAIMLAAQARPRHLLGSRTLNERCIKISALQATHRVRLLPVERAARWKLLMHSHWRLQAEYTMTLIEFT